MKIFLLWLPMVFIGIFNGTLRELTYKSYIGDLAAHQISTVTGIIFITIYVFSVFKYLKVSSVKDTIRIGLLWLLFTIIFEFGFGHYVMGNSFEKLFADYNILAGRVWLLFLIWLTAAPYFIYKIKNRNSWFVKR